MNLGKDKSQPINSVDRMVTRGSAPGSSADVAESLDPGNHLAVQLSVPGRLSPPESTERKRSKRSSTEDMQHDRVASLKEDVMEHLAEKQRHIASLAEAGQEA